MPNATKQAAEALPTVRELRSQLRQCMGRYQTLTRLLSVAERAVLTDCDSPEELVAAAVSALRSEDGEGRQLAAQLLGRLRHEFGISLMLGSEVSFG